MAEPYKIGNRTADVMLEVLNLDKKEVVSIDGISNQDFTEVMRDECFPSFFSSHLMLLY